MRIAVVGATGRNGRLILREAVRRGHRVTGLARRPGAPLDAGGPAELIEGDARDADVVGRLVEGQDAVIVSVSGASAQIARTVAGAMEARGVRRLVSVSAYGIVATRPYVVAPLVRRILRGTFAEQVAADDAIRASGLDWTIVRATRLTGRSANGPARVQPAPFAHGPWSVSREALASVLLDLAEQHRHVREILNVSA